MGLPWIKNSKGDASASLTMAIVSFVVITLWLIVWLVATPFGVAVPAFEASTAMAYLTPMLALYFGRRWTSDGGKVTAEGAGASQSDPAVSPPQK